MSEKQLFGQSQILDAMKEASKRMPGHPGGMPDWKLKSKYAQGQIKVTVLVTLVRQTEKYVVYQLASGKEKWFKKIEGGQNWWANYANIQGAVHDGSDAYITGTVAALKKIGLLEKS